MIFKHFSKIIKQKILLNCLWCFPFLLQPSNLRAHEINQLQQFCRISNDYKGCIESNKLYNQSEAAQFLDINNIWRTYGTLRINWSAWRSKGDNHIVTALNKDDKSIYIAVNCNKNLLNTTGVRARWKGWLPPSEKFERNLLKDLCISLK